MSTFRLFFVTLALGGLASGASALEAVSLADPALRWLDVPLVMVGMTAALLQLLGLQAAAGRGLWVRRSWQACVLAGAGFLAAGAEALRASAAARNP